MSSSPLGYNPQSVVNFLDWLLARGFSIDSARDFRVGNTSMFGGHMKRNHKCDMSGSPSVGLSSSDTEIPLTNTKPSTNKSSLWELVQHISLPETFFGSFPVIYYRPFGPYILGECIKKYRGRETEKPPPHWALLKGHSKWAPRRCKDVNMAAVAAAAGHRESFRI